AEDVSCVLNKAEPDNGIDLDELLRVYPRGFAAVLPYSKEVSRSLNVGLPVVVSDPRSDISARILEGCVALVPAVDIVHEWPAKAVAHHWGSKRKDKHAPAPARVPLPVLVPPLLPGLVPGLVPALAAAGAGRAPATAPPPALEAQPFTWVQQVAAAAAVEAGRPGAPDVAWPAIPSGNQVAALPAAGQAPPREAPRVPAVPVQQVKPRGWFARHFGREDAAPGHAETGGKPAKVRPDKAKPEKIKPEKARAPKAKLEKLKPEKVRPETVRPETVKPEKVKKEKLRAEKPQPAPTPEKVPRRPPRVRTAPRHRYGS
ncbi:MAG TPA: hypothetical protein VFW71_06530, partial [Actinomycetota bacterium]|nr:hypothetical protein [Actinomycetota bacterium]